MTGTKEGYGLGEWSACTVIMDGRTMNSCLILAPEAEDKEIITIEGLAQGDTLHPIQEIFIEQGGFSVDFVL